MQSTARISKGGDNTQTCKGCTTRHVGCHSSCEIYAANVEHWRKVRAAEKADCKPYIIYNKTRINELYGRSGRSKDKLNERGQNMLNVDTNRIGAIIAQSGLTYADVADEAGITRATFSCVMKRGTARVLTLGKIAKALGVDATEILQK